MCRLLNQKASCLSDAAQTFLVLKLNLLKHIYYLSSPAHKSRTHIARIQPLTPIITFDRILLKGNSRWENIRLFLLSNLRIETLGWGETLECLPFCVRRLPLSDVYGGRQGEEEQGQEGRLREHQDQELGGLCPLLLPAKKFVLISSLQATFCHYWCNSGQILTNMVTD